MSERQPSRVEVEAARLSLIGLIAALIAWVRWSWLTTVATLSTHKPQPFTWWVVLEFLAFITVILVGLAIIFGAITLTIIGGERLYKWLRWALTTPPAPPAGKAAGVEEV